MTQHYEFRTVPHIIQERGATKQLGTVLRTHFKGNNIVLVTDQFLHKSGMLNAAIESLKAQNWNVLVIDDVIADPPEHIILQATQKAQQASVDLVLGLGGGSSMDVAKLLAVLIPNQQDLASMYGINQIHTTRLPLVQVPTTAGTGSEVTAVSIVTTGATTKSGVVSPKLLADLAILDAELTLSLPAPVSAATGIDAMVHAIEAYTSKHLKNPVSDMLACQALRLLAPNLLTVCQDGHNYAAREAMLLGAMFAGQSFANAPVGAVHALAYPLGGIFHIPHGLSNSLVLPHVLRFNAPNACTMYANLADIVLPTSTGSDEAKTMAFIQFMENLAIEAGIPTQLRHLDIKTTDIEQLAIDAMKQTRLLGNNPRELTQQDALAIYQAAW